MNELENKPAPGVDGNESNSESLQLQLTLQLLALVVMAATMAFFFYMQARRARFDLNALKPPAMAIIQSFEQEKPGVDTFLAKLAEYGRTHPDFVPIMQKYNFPTNLPVPAPATKATVPAGTAAPKPVAPAPKK